jgi:hypothetical protein
LAEFKHRIGKLDPNQITMTVSLDVRELRVRMAIGLWLIKLGARVIGLGVVVEALKTDPEDCVSPVAPPPVPEPDDFRRGG